MDEHEGGENRQVVAMATPTQMQAKQPISDLAILGVSLDSRGSSPSPCSECGGDHEKTRPESQLLHLVVH